MNRRRKLLERAAPIRGAMKDLMAQYPAGTACLALFATLSTALPFLRRTLIEVRDLSERFEPWRHFTGHFVHGSFEHLALNLSVFVPLSAWRERKVGFARTLLEILTIAAVVTLGVRWLHTGWDTYCGLSGIVYGLLVIVLLDGTIGARDHGALKARLCVGPLVIAFLAVKTAIECIQNGWIWQRGLLESTLGVIYLSGSHASGLLAGLAIVLAASFSGGTRSQSVQPDKKSRTADPGSAESRMAPIMAAPAAPAFLSSCAVSAVTPPSA